MQVHGRIVALVDQPWGVEVVADNGPISLKFVVNDPELKRTLRIGQVVRAKLEFADN